MPQDNMECEQPRPWIFTHFIQFFFALNSIESKSARPSLMRRRRLSLRKNKTPRLFGAGCGCFGNTELVYKHNNAIVAHFNNTATNFHKNGVVIALV